MFLSAYEKFEKGDKEAMQKLCKNVSERKGSVDLLENMDLDFAFEDKNSTEAFFATVSASSSIKGVTGSSNRRPSIDSHVRSNSIFGLTDADQPLTAFNSSVFDDNQHQVELSAYEAMAKSLSSSKSAPKGGTKVGYGRPTPARPSSRGIVSASASQVALAALRSPSDGGGAGAAVSSVNTALARNRDFPLATTTISTAVANTFVSSNDSDASKMEVKSKITSHTITSSAGSSSIELTKSPAGSATPHSTPFNAKAGPVLQVAHGAVKGSIVAPPVSQQVMKSIPISSSPAAIMPPSGASVGGTSATLPVTVSTPLVISSTPAAGVSVVPAPINRADAEALGNETDRQNVISLTIAGGPLWAKSAEGPENRHYIGVYSPEQRKKRIERFIEKRTRRVWTKKVKYDVRKNFADSRLRVKGRFVKKEDEEIMRELMTI